MFLGKKLECMTFINLPDIIFFIFFITLYLLIYFDSIFDYSTIILKSHIFSKFFLIYNRKNINMISVWQFIKKYYTIIFFAIIIVLSFFLFQTCSNLKKAKEDVAYQEKQNAQNMSALKDSIKVEFNKKLKAYEFSKDNYVVQKLSDLQKYNQSLYDEIKKIKGDVIAAINTKVQGDLGGIKADNKLVIIDSTKRFFGLKFRSLYADSGFQQKLVGTSRFYIIPNGKIWHIQPDITLFDTNLTSIEITYGFKELKDKYQVFALSTSPKIQLTDLTGGYFIDKQPPPPPVKPKNWAIGPYIGFGLNTDYNLANPRFGWSIGFSVHYDVFQWRFGKK